MPHSGTFFYSEQRRQCGKAIISLALLSSIFPVRAQSEKEFKLTWTVPSNRVAIARASVNFKADQVRGDPASETDSKGLPLLYILIGVALLPEIAKGLVTVYKDWENGATIVDATGDRLTITHDPQGSSDVTVVKTDGGKVAVYDNRKSFDAAKWVEILTSATKKSAK